MDFKTSLDRWLTKSPYDECGGECFICGDEYQEDELLDYRHDEGERDHGRPDTL